MDPSNNESLSLPPPVPASEQAPAEAGNIEAIPMPVEQAPGGSERAPSNTSAAAALPVIPLPMPTVPMPGVATTDVSSTSQSVVPSSADDTDLIEKEWVTKAKQ